jgi:hypothetical protein
MMMGNSGSVAIRESRMPRPLPSRQAQIEEGDVERRRGGDAARLCTRWRVVDLETHCANALARLRARTASSSTIRSVDMRLRVVYEARR